MPAPFIADLLFIAKASVGSLILFGSPICLFALLSFRTDKMHKSIESERYKAWLATQ